MKVLLGTGSNTRTRATADTKDFIIPTDQDSLKHFGDAR
jgi:hypothetical protein